MPNGEPTMTLSDADKTRFLQALSDDPDFLQQVRQHVLTADLIALPEQFGNFVRLTDERFGRLEETLAQFAELTNQRLTSLESDVSTLKSDVSTLKSDVGTLKSDVSTLKSDVGTLKSDVSTLKSDVGTLKSDVSTLKSDVSTLKSDVSTLKSDVSTLKSDVGTLIGDNLERRVRESILNIARDELDLTRGRILLARGRDTVPQFLESINAAEEQGLITEQQADHVLVADIVIRARRADDKQYVYGVFEVSRTIRLSDIQRAHDRAIAVAAATHEDAVAVVVGEAIQPQQQAQADEMGVRVLIPAMLRQRDAAADTDS